MLLLKKNRTFTFDFCFFDLKTNSKKRLSLYECFNCHLGKNVKIRTLYSFLYKIFLEKYSVREKQF